MLFSFLFFSPCLLLLLPPLVVADGSDQRGNSRLPPHSNPASPQSDWSLSMSWSCTELPDGANHLARTFCYRCLLNGRPLSRLPTRYKTACSCGRGREGSLLPAVLHGLALTQTCPSLTPRPPCSFSAVVSYRATAACRALTAL